MEQPLQQVGPAPERLQFLNGQFLLPIWKHSVPVRVSDDGRGAAGPRSTARLPHRS